jgi:hypothetical protein
MSSLDAHIHTPAVGNTLKETNACICLPGLTAAAVATAATAAALWEPHRPPLLRRLQQHLPALLCHLLHLYCLPLLLPLLLLAGLLLLLPAALCCYRAKSPTPWCLHAPQALPAL